MTTAFLKRVATQVKWHAFLLLSRLRLLVAFHRARVILDYLLKRPHEADFRIFSSFDGEKGLFVDIGANSGQSALACRMFNKSFQILSFEPNPFQKSNLNFVKTLLGDLFDYQLIGLGKEAQIKTLHVPYVNGVAFTQEASFNEMIIHHPLTTQRIQSLCGSSKIQIEKYEIIIKTLDEFNLQPDFVKIDVQGWELEVLEGMMMTIHRHRPILIIENSENLDQIIAWLRTFHYQGFEYNPYSRQVSYLRDSDLFLNILFIPAEKFAYLGNHGVDLSQVM